MPDPIKVDITLDLDRHLAGGVVGYDEDGDPVTGPTTVEDLILKLAADQVTQHYLRDRSAWNDGVRDRVTAIRDQVIADLVRPDIEAALTAPIQRTNSYGEATGAETTLRELIVQQVQDWLTSSDRDSYRNPKHLTKPQQIIAEQVNQVLAKEMKAAVDQAKAEVVAAVKAKGAEILAKTIADMAGGAR